MPASRIRANYDELAQMASIFARQAQQTQAMLRKVKNQVDTLQRGEWLGQGARAFYREMDQDVLPTLTRLAKALEEAQRTTVQISRILKEAEGEAARVLGADGGGAGATGDGRGGLPGWLSGAIGALGLGGAGLTGLGALASRVARAVDNVRAGYLDDMVKIFARGGEDALTATGIHRVVARWTSNAAKASNVADFLNRWSDRVGKVAAVGTGIDQAFSSSAETWVGKLTSGGGAGALAWASRNNPYLAVADLGFSAVGLGKDRPSAIVGNSVDNIVTLGEGMFTGSTRGMESIHSRNLSGENGWVFQQAAEAGDFWAENGISGGLGMFWTEVKGLF